MNSYLFSIFFLISVQSAADFLRRNAFGVGLERGFAVREGLGVDDPLMHPRVEHQAERIERHGRAVIVAQIGPDARQHELERLAGLPDQRQALDQRAKVGRGRVQRDQDEIGQREQIGVDGADRGRRIDEEIGGAGLARAPRIRPDRSERVRAE